MSFDSLCTHGLGDLARFCLTVWYLYGDGHEEVVEYCLECTTLDDEEFDRTETYQYLQPTRLNRRIGFTPEEVLAVAALVGWDTYLTPEERTRLAPRVEALLRETEDGLQRQRDTLHADLHRHGLHPRLPPLDLAQVP